MAPSRVRQLQSIRTHVQTQARPAAVIPQLRPAIRPAAQQVRNAVTGGATYNAFTSTGGVTYNAVTSTGDTAYNAVTSPTGATSGQITFQRRPLQPQAVTTLRPVFSQATPPTNNYRPLPLSNSVNVRQNKPVKGGTTSGIGVASLARAPVKVNSQQLFNQNRVNALTTNSIENSGRPNLLSLRTLSNQNMLNNVQNRQRFVTPVSGTQTARLGPRTNVGVSSSLGPVRQVFPAQGSTFSTAPQQGNLIGGSLQQGSASDGVSHQTRVINNEFQGGRVINNNGFQQANGNGGSFTQTSGINGGLQQQQQQGNVFFDSGNQQQGSVFIDGGNQQQGNAFIGSGNQQQGNVFIDSGNQQQGNAFIESGSQLQQGNVFIDGGSQLQQGGFNTAGQQANIITNNDFKQNNVLNNNQQGNVFTSNTQGDIISYTQQDQQPAVSVTQADTTNTISFQSNNSIVSSGNLLTSSGGYQYPDAGLSPALQTTATAATSITATAATAVTSTVAGGQLAPSSAGGQLSGAVDVRAAGTRYSLLQPTASDFSPALTQSAPTAIGSATDGIFTHGDTGGTDGTSTTVITDNPDSPVSVNSGNFVSGDTGDTINDDFIGIIDGDLDGFSSAGISITGTLDSTSATDVTETDAAHNVTTDQFTFSSSTDGTETNDITRQNTAIDQGLFTLLDSAHFSSAVQPDPSTNDVLTTTDDVTAAFDDVTSGGQFIVDGMTFDENGVFTLELVEAPLQANLQSSVAEFDFGGQETLFSEPGTGPSNTQDISIVTSVGDSTNYYDDYSSTFDLSSLDFEDAAKFDAVGLTDPSLGLDDPSTGSSGGSQSSSVPSGGVDDASAEAAALLASAEVSGPLLPSDGGPLLPSDGQPAKQSRKRNAFWSHWLPGRWVEYSIV